MYKWNKFDRIDKKKYSTENIHNVSLREREKRKREKEDADE